MMRGTKAVAARTDRLPGIVWIGSAVTLLASSADTFVLFALFWLAEPQGWSGIQTALIVLVLRLPALASGLWVGRAVDRWGPLPPMLIDLAGRAVLLAALAASALGGPGLSLAAVLVLGGLGGALSPATYAGIRTLIPRVVPATQLVRANARIAVGDQLQLVLGTVFVGPALAHFGPGGGLLVPVAMLLIALLLALKLLRTDTVPVAKQRPDDRREPGRIWTPRVIMLIALSVAYYLAYGPFETASPAYVRDQLSGGEGTYSLIWALFGIGALASLPLAPHLARLSRPGIVNALGAVAWGMIMLPAGLVSDAPAAMVIFLLGGAVWGPYTTIETSALQRWVPLQRQGAVFGLQRSLLTTAAPLGAAIGAIAVVRLEPSMVLILSAAGCTVAGLLAIASRDLRTAQGG